MSTKSEKEKCDVRVHCSGPSARGAPGFSSSCFHGSRCSDIRVRIHIHVRDRWSRRMRWQMASHKARASPPQCAERCERRYDWSEMAQPCPASNNFQRAQTPGASTGTPPPNPAFVLVSNTCEACFSSTIHLLLLPSLKDFSSGKVSISETITIKLPRQDHATPHHGSLRSQTPLLNRWH
jgi:hypothetical protein